jgi:hypothetical protein
MISKSACSLVAEQATHKDCPCSALKCTGIYYQVLLCMSTWCCCMFGKWFFFVAQKKRFRSKNIRCRLLLFVLLSLLFSSYFFCVPESLFFLATSLCCSLFSLPSLLFFFSGCLCSQVTFLLLATSLFSLAFFVVLLPWYDIKKCL